MILATILASAAMTEQSRQITEQPPKQVVRPASQADLDMIPRPPAIQRQRLQRQPYAKLDGWTMEEQSSECRYHVAFGGIGEAVTFRRTLRGRQTLLVTADALGIQGDPPEYGTAAYEASKTTLYFGMDEEPYTRSGSSRERLRGGRSWGKDWSMGIDDFTALEKDSTLRFTIGDGRNLSIPVSGFAAAMVNLDTCMDNIRLARLDMRPEGEAFAYGPFGPWLENNPGEWIQYPSRALRADEEGSVGFAIQVDRYGLPKSCRVTSSSGSDALDRATCSQLQRRALFYPARDANDRAVAGTYSNSMRWILPE